MPLPEAPASSLVEARRRTLSPMEIDRAERLRSVRLHRQFIVWHGGLRTILGWYTGLPPGEVLIEHEEHGKPVLRPGRAGPGEPVPHFNLSHSHDLALAAVTIGAPVGVDVERVRRLADADRIAARFFAAAEYERYRAIGADERHLAFFNAWTRKEAVIKALGQGLSRPLASVEVTLAPGEPARLVRFDGQPGESAGWSLHAFEPLPGYCGAVAVPQAHVASKCFELS
jgi:4'-phosphopantetheinyl transferase